MTDQNKPALKPCPFCGCEAEVVGRERYNHGQFGGYAVSCRHCWAAVGLNNCGDGEAGGTEPDNDFNSQEEAIAAWNTRAEPAPTDEDARRALDWLEERYKMMQEPRGAIEHTAEALFTIRRALEQMQGWQPIETAPRDTPILGCKASNGCIDILQIDTPVDWRYGSPPTHWIPLPAPPKSEGGA